MALRAAVFAIAVLGTYGLQQDIAALAAQQDVADEEFTKAHQVMLEEAEARWAQDFPEFGSSLLQTEEETVPENPFTLSLMQGEEKSARARRNSKDVEETYQEEEQQSQDEEDADSEDDDEGSLIQLGSKDPAAEILEHMVPAQREKLEDTENSLLQQKFPKVGEAMIAAKALLLNGWESKEENKDKEGTLKSWLLSHKDQEEAVSDSDKVDSLMQLFSKDDEEDDADSEDDGDDESLIQIGSKAQSKLATTLKCASQNAVERVQRQKRDADLPVNKEVDVADEFLVSVKENEGKISAKQLLKKMPVSQMQVITESERVEMEAKKLRVAEMTRAMDTRTGRTLQKSARIDALVDAAIMAYLENPEGEPAKQASLLQGVKSEIVYAAGAIKEAFAGASFGTIAAKKHTSPTQYRAVYGGKVDETKQEAAASPDARHPHGQDYLPPMHRQM